MAFHKTSLSSRSTGRRGAAMIEFAICMPIFFLITMGTIETCHMIYLRQSLKIAAYESARLGIVPEMTRETLQDQCDVLLQRRNIRSYQFSCSPDNPAMLEYGELFTTTVQAPASANALVGSWFYQDKTFSESVSIMAEH